MSRIQIFLGELKGRTAEIEKYVRETFPRKAQKVAVDHFRENFQQGGFVDGGLHPWPEPQRRKKKKPTVASQYKTLLSGRNNLYESVRGRAEDGRAVISTDVEYAAIHNEGGTINHPISRNMRVKAYETHIKKKGGQHRTSNSMWKGLALTKRTSYTIKMPKRQFIGNSKELDDKLLAMAEKDLQQIINQ